MEDVVLKQVIFQSKTVIKNHLDLLLTGKQGYLFSEKRKDFVRQSIIS